MLCIPQSSSITGTSPSNCLVSYLGHSLVGFNPSACNIARCGYVKYTDTWNVHIQRNPETLETLMTFFNSGTKLLLPSLSLSFQYEERDTQFLLCWLFHLTQQRAAYRVDPTGLASPRSKNQLASSSFKSQLRWTARPGVRISTNCFFSKITQNPQPIASGQDVIPNPSIISYPGFLLWHLW